MAEAQNEFVMAMVGVILHEVPENRPMTNVDHRFRDLFGMFPKPGAETAAE
jgi:hypothetical protein